MHPVLSLRLSECACPSAAAGVVGVGAASDGCCESVSTFGEEPAQRDANAPERDDREPDDEPSDRCECPLACCGILKSVTASLPVTSMSWSARVVERSASLNDSRSESPHLRGLRRPPKQTAAA